jgi:hypothetical protein
MANPLIAYGNIPEQIGDHDIRLRNAFMGLTETFQIGDKVGGELRDSTLYKLGSYTPPLFRRKRLQRWAPLARRAHFARSAWQWSAAASGETQQTR